MGTNNRFDVKLVSEDSPLDGNFKMMGLPNSGVPDLEHGHATYPGASSEPKTHRISIAHLTREALPRLDHYRNGLEGTKRPTLGELHGELSEEKVSPLYITTQVNEQRQLKENLMRLSDRKRDFNESVFSFPSSSTPQPF
jgi:hypothetical protein